MKFVKTIFTIIKWGFYIIATMVGVVGIIAWWSFSGVDKPTGKPTAAPQQTLEEDRKSTARAICNQLILKNLNDPSSAQTGPLSDGFYGLWPAKSIGKSRIKVTARFRAKNAFGALIVTQFKCVLRFDGSDVVAVDSLVEQ